MALKRHHKIILGGIGTIVIIAVIGLSIMMYSLYIKQTQDYTSLNDKILELQTSTQARMNSLSTSLLQLQNSTENTQQQLNLLKASASSDFSGIVENAIKSVVIIKTDVAQGSGFIITNDGYVVTNEHVMENAAAASIITSDGQAHAVRMVGYDSNIDLALLKIDGTYSPLQLANSDNVNVGEKVIAIGNPYGLQFSVTEGIVSNVNQVGSNGLNYYIQTDAALNPGNSGGPLIDTTGKVIGINNFKISGGENLGFALESNYIKQTINQIAQQSLNQTALI